MPSKHPYLVASSYPRFFRRNHTFYIRIAIPRFLWYITKRKEIKYSLRTNNYADALFKLKCESIKLDFFIETLKDIDMRIKDGKLLLEDADIQKLILFRLKEIDRFCEENKYALLHREKTDDDITLFSNKALNLWHNKIYDPELDCEDNEPNRWSFELETIKNKIIDFLKDLREQDTTPDNIINIIDDVIQGKLNPLPVLAHSPLKEVSPKLPKVMGELHSLDNYAIKQVKSIVDGTDFIVPRKYQPYIKAIELEKAQQMLQASSTKTQWKDVAISWLKEKKLKGTKKDATLREYASYLNIIFLFLEKEFVEDITKKDIKKLCYEIGQFPSYVMNYLKKGKKIKDVLVDKTSPNAMSDKTIQQYLIAFQSFMVYAKKEGIIRDSFKVNFIIPKVKRNRPEREAFTEQDLLLIFNPKCYPYELDETTVAYFWVPLIALYVGNRISEITQLDVEDVVVDEEIPYFKFRANTEDKCLKTEASWREVPIHPDLIELGFIDFVLKQKQGRNIKLFSSLKLDKNRHNGYSNAIGKWFNERYLLWLGVKTEKKSFHSFRYNVKQALRPYRIPKELLNPILGWEREDIGDSVYGGIVPAKELYSDYIKLQYPFLKSTLLALKKRTDTHYKMSAKKIKKLLASDKE